MKWYLFIMMMTVSLFAGCGVNKEDVSKVRIAHFPNITHSQALLQRNNETSELTNKKGEKIPVEWKALNAGPAEVEALLAGEVDIGYIGPGPAINAYVKSKGDVVIIAGATNAGAILIARNDLPQTDLKTLLENNRIAVPQFGNTQDLCLRNIMSALALTDKAKGGSVEVVQAENPDIKTLLESKEIGAALVPEPWGARLVNESKARIVLDDKGIWRNGEYTTAVVVVRKEFLKKHPDLVEDFLRQHVKTTLELQEDLVGKQSVVNQQIAKLTQKELPEKVFAEAFSRMRVTYDPQQDSVFDMVKMSVAAGFLRQEPDTKGLFELELLNKILQEKGLPTI